MKINDHDLDNMIAAMTITHGSDNVTVLALMELRVRRSAQGPWSNSRFVFGTCTKCGKRRVRGRSIDGLGKPGVFYANGHTSNGASCSRGELLDVEPRGTRDQPLPETGVDVRSLDDDQLQALLEQVEAEILRRA